MLFSELYGVNIPAEVENLIQNSPNLNERLVKLLKDVAIDNENIDKVNLFVLKYILGEVSEEDVLIAINRYKASTQSVVD